MSCKLFDCEANAEETPAAFGDALRSGRNRLICGSPGVVGSTRRCLRSRRTVWAVPHTPPNSWPPPTTRGAGEVPAQLLQCRGPREGRFDSVWPAAHISAAEIRRARSKANSCQSRRSNLPADPIAVCCH
eukprot:362899-Chlamydomonas_euryale.AAC.9